VDWRATFESKLLPLLGAVLSDSVRDAGTFRFDKRKPQQLAAVCTYCSIIELTHGEVALIEKGQTTALPVVLRSIFEAYADLSALLNDPDYHKNMYATFLHEKIRFLKNVLRTPSNPFLLGVSTGIDAKTEIRNFERELAQYEKAGRNPLNHSSRFDLGKLTHEYQSIYWLLCLDSHNNMSALDDRHIEGQGKDFNVVLFKAADPADLTRLIDALAALVIESSRQVHSFLNTGAVMRYEAHRKTLDLLRNEYSKA
jgi:hypothetical protein